MRRSDLVECINIVDVNLKGSEFFSEKVSSLFEGDSYVFTQVMSDEFEELSWTALCDRLQKRLIAYTNVYFSGLHPDLTYFGKRGLRVASPLGDYHSRIVLAAFIQDRTPDECLSAFDGKTYERLGYFSHFIDSAEELKRRDKSNQIKFATLFEEMSRSRLTMLSVNHPTAGTIIELARMIEAFFSDKRSAMTPSVCTSPLAVGPVWPLYPEIREYNQLPYETAFIFYPPEGAGRALTLQEFVLASYASYARQGRAVLSGVDSNSYYAHLPVL